MYHKLAIFAWTCVANDTGTSERGNQARKIKSSCTETCMKIPNFDLMRRIEVFRQYMNEYKLRNVAHEMNVAYKSDFVLIFYAYI